MNRDAYEKVRKVWSINPAEKVEGVRQNEKSFNRRRENQKLNSFVGRVSQEDLDELEFEDDEGLLPIDVLPEDVAVEDVAEDSVEEPEEVVSK